MTFCIPSEDSDDDIPIPDGPPPRSIDNENDNAESDDDDIPFPEGPPPSNSVDVVDGADGASPFS